MAPHAVVRRSLAAYAIGALDEDERAGLEEHLETCAGCRAEVVDLREAAAGLTPDGEPPAGVWSQVSQSIQERKNRAAEAGPGSSEVDRTG